MGILWSDIKKEEREAEKKKDKEEREDKEKKDQEEREAKEKKDQEEREAKEKKDQEEREAKEKRDQERHDKMLQELEKKHYQTLIAIAAANGDEYIRASPAASETINKYNSTLMKHHRKIIADEIMGHIDRLDVMERYDPLEHTTPSERSLQTKM